MGYKTANLTKEQAEELIVVRAVKRPGCYGAGKDATLHYPVDSNRLRAGEPFIVKRKDFSPVRQENGIELGWMEEVSGYEISQVPQVRRAVLSSEVADESKVPVPHTRRDRLRDERGRLMPDSKPKI